MPEKGMHFNAVQCTRFTIHRDSLSPKAPTINAYCTAQLDIITRWDFALYNHSTQYNIVQQKKLFSLYFLLKHFQVQTGEIFYTYFNLIYFLFTKKLLTHQ